MVADSIDVVSHRKSRLGDPVIREGGDGRYSWASAACRELLGWDPDELVGRAAADFIHPDDRLRAGDAAFRHLRRDGGAVWVEPRWVPGGAEPERVLVAVALPAGIAEALRASEQRFELAFNDGQIGMAVVSLDGTWLRVNPALCRIVGYSETQLLGARVQEITHPDDLDADLDLMAEMVRGERARYSMDKRYVRGDGTLAWVRLSVSIATDESGGPAYFVSQVQDVTHHRRQERRLEDAASEYAALHRVAAAVAHGIGEEDLWALVAREAAGLFGVDTAIVARFGGAQATVVGSHGGQFALGTHLSTSGSGVLAQVARTHAGARVDDYEGLGAGSGRLREQAMARGLVASVAAPIMVDGGVWGALLASTPDTAGFAVNATDRLARFAELVALGIANAQARSELLSRAMTDALTGLTNHRAFHERLAVEVERADRHGRALAVAVMDLDHFKAVNDTYGHPVGDRVLRELADRLRGLTRPEDEFARVGGEEFALLLPECDPPAAQSILERMRRAVADAPFAEVRGRVTISIGVAHLADANGPNELYQQADEALYVAKEEGRDRVTTWARGLSAVPAAGPHEGGERQRTVEGILALARAVDARDPGMRRHSGRVADLAVRLATVLGWRIEDCALLRDAGLVHDVGKIGVSDSILLKAGRLTPAEREQVQLHAALGAQIARDVLTYDQVGWVRSHHERWDGSGYPDRLAGEQIPPGARILAVADAFDHMTATRSYVRTRSVEEAVAECRRLAGTQFAPEVVTALERLEQVGALARAEAA